MDRKVFFDGVRLQPFGGFLTQGAVDGLNALLDAWEHFGQTDIRWLAYDLATTFHETGRTMQPIEEYGKGKGHPYGFPGGPWHAVYDGRGDVQLTWEANYAHATKRLRELGIIGNDIDLEKTPALALRPDIAAAILFLGSARGWFTGHKLADYIHGDVCNYEGCRNIINPGDRAVTIAAYAASFERALKAATANQMADGLPAPVNPVTPAQKPNDPPSPPASAPPSTTKGTTGMSANFWKGIFGWFMAGSAGLIALLPPQYQWIATMLIGIFGGAHGITSSLTNPAPVPSGTVPGSRSTFS